MHDFTPETLELMRLRWPAVTAPVYCVEDVMRGAAGPEEQLHKFDFADGMRLVVWREIEECGCRRLHCACRLRGGLPQCCHRAEPWSAVQLAEVIGLVHERLAAIGDVRGRIVFRRVNLKEAKLHFFAEIRQCPQWLLSRPR
jgi:hypothetical protein